MKPEFQKLASEYRAIDRVDQLVERVHPLAQGELIGRKVRVRQRAEIRFEILMRISRAEVSSSHVHDQSGTLEGMGSNHLPF